MQAWERFLKLQESEIGKETVNRWLRSLTIIRYDACNLYLEAKDAFHTLWFEEHIRTKAESQLLNGSQKKINVHLSIADASQSITKKSRPLGKKAKNPAHHTFELTFDDLDPHCRFETFVIGRENVETADLVLELAGHKSGALLESVNPIFLYGPTGIGKTHLLMGLAHSFRSRGFRAVYVRAELFTDHVVSAIRAGEMSVFRQAYRTAEILIVDDIQVFSRKGATQEEFFHTFNTLHLADKRIILSANCPPQELEHIEPRLISRFEWGIALPIKPLLPDERKEMLLAKARALDLNISSKVADFLLEHFTSSSKALIKALEALALRLHIDQRHSSQQLSPTAARVILADLIIEEEKATLSPSQIVQKVAEYFGIRSEDIFGKSQSRDCALPRQIAMHLCREKLKIPYARIGDLFSRDHSTVMSSVKAIQKSLERDENEIIAARHHILKKLGTAAL
jgi:chromosomal replication initiator protein